MSDWASRRKAIFLGALVLILTAFSFAVFWYFWYQTPSCSDGKKDGDETGIDCGGSCTKVCSSEAIAPVIKWDPRLFQVLSGTWSALVYVENANVDLDATYVPYTFTIYDADNNVLATRTSATILPKNKTVGIFEGSIEIAEGKTPKRAVFEINDGVIWKKNEEIEKSISITYSPLSRLDTEPRIETTVKNNLAKEIKNIELVAVVFDGSDNAVAASRTLIEDLKNNESTEVFFTWPRPFELGSKVCEKDSDVMLLLDRSGSMASASSTPPQPLTDAKLAAESFIDSLNTKDQVGVVSFATNVKDPIDLNLTSDFSFAKQSVDSIAIATSSTQYTNIYEALHSAWQELISTRNNADASKVIILLTDGIATYPKSPTGKTEAEDIKYAESQATSEADSIKQNNITLYTIGLGNAVNTSFLKSMASAEDNYFLAPNASDLAEIYENISSDICKEIPARIEITYKIFGDSI